MTALPAGATKIVDFYAADSLSVAFFDLMAWCASEHLDGDVAFYAAQAGGPGAWVLELGCGTGRVTLGLAAKGVGVTGIDLSEDMLAAARKELAKAGPEIRDRVRLLTADMTTLDLGQAFDAVIAPYYAINHLDAPARKKTLHGIARHLATGRRLAIHALKPETLSLPIDEEVLRQGITRVQLGGDGHSLAVRILGRKVNEEQRLNEQMVEYRVHAPDGSVLRRTVECLRYHWFEDAEIVAEAASAGLGLLETRSSFRDGVEGIERIYVFERRA